MNLLIYSKQLEGRRLATTVDNEVLKTFLSSILDSIIILDGRVKTVVFRNGLSHTFVFRK